MAATSENCDRRISSSTPTPAKTRTSLSGDLVARGFDAQCGEQAPDGKWSVLASRQASVDDVTSAACVEQLVRLTASYLAEFDGWGTTV
jgi:Regulator of ribonuclease activity B